MTKSNTDLIVGASIFAALFILIAGVMWLKEVNVARKMVTYTVHFPNVGTLQVGDPVTVNGVKRGAVARMYLKNSRVAVDMKLSRSIRLTDSCTVTVQNIGLMGERMIGIQLTSKGTPYSPNEGDSTTWIAGNFDSGIAEAMGMLGAVLGDVEVLVASVRDILNETVADTQFAVVFHDVVDRLDNVTVLVEHLVETNKPGIDRTVSDLQVVSRDLRTLVEDSRADISTIAENGADLTERALLVAERVDSIAMSARALMNTIEDGEGTLGLLVENEAFRQDFETSLANIDTLVRDVQDHGLKLRVKLGFGKPRKK